MDKSQFILPFNESTSATPPEQASFALSPERLRPPFQFVKQVEELVDSMRQTAEAIEQKNGREVRLRYIPVTLSRPPRSHSQILSEQLAAEAELTMPLFAEKAKYRMWYGGTAHTPQATPHLASWFIEELVPGKVGAGRITRIQTHPDHVQMFNHEGHLVHMTIADLEIFITLVKSYVPTILAAYPFERDRAEVLLEDITMPDGIDALLLPRQSTSLPNNTSSGWDLAA